VKATTATVLWFDDVKGYGFAVTPDGRKLFLHYRNFVREQQMVVRSLVQGVTIECEFSDVVNDFAEALNSGSLRDSGMNHRRPRTAANISTRNPVALRIRVVESCGR